jgi:hypothetical protein
MARTLGKHAETEIPVLLCEHKLNGIKIVWESDEQMRHLISLTGRRQEPKRSLEATVYATCCNIKTILFRQIVTKLRDVWFFTATACFPDIIKRWVFWWRRTVISVRWEPKFTYKWLSCLTPWLKALSVHAEDCWRWTRVASVLWELSTDWMDVWGLVPERLWSHWMMAAGPAGEIFWVAGLHNVGNGACPFCQLHPGIDLTTGKIPDGTHTAQRYLQLPTVTERFNRPLQAARNKVAKLT